LLSVAAPLTALRRCSRAGLKPPMLLEASLDSSDGASVGSGELLQGLTAIELR
jgi:hypothetical protein